MKAPIMYMEPCARFTKFMMPKTRVRPAAMRKSRTPSCRPLRAWMTNRLKLTIPPRGQAGGTKAARGHAFVLHFAHVVAVSTGGDHDGCGGRQHGYAGR